MFPGPRHQHVWNFTGRCSCGIALKIDGTPLDSDTEFEPRLGGAGPQGDSTGPGRGDPSEGLLRYLDILHGQWIAGRCD